MKNLTNSLFSLIFYLTVFSLVSLFLAPLSLAGDWKVSPIRIDLDKNAKSGAVRIVNEGDERLTVQMKAMEWTQDAEGKDIYTDTEDIIFFPKLMTIEKQEERILRAGIKIPAVAKEKTFRLFVEEIPEPKGSEGVNVAIAIRFGVPIFVKPLKVEAKGEIEKVEFSKGVAAAAIKNTGNIHFMINAVNFRGKNDKGEEIFAKDINGWYLLSGSSRIYSEKIPKEICKDLSKIEVQVATDKLNLSGKTDVDTAMCLY
jgi:fimbrial chaperone protein